MAIRTSTRQIARFLNWNFRGAIAAVTIVLGIWLVHPRAITLWLAAVVAVNAVIVGSAERIARGGDPERAAIRFAMSAWIVKLVVGLLVQSLFPLSMLVAFLPLGLVIPYGSRRLQRRAFAVSGLIVGFVATATFFPPLVSIDFMPDLVVHGMNVVFVPVLGALFCLAVWGGLELLQEAHRELLISHRAVQESEASLEHKVAERTAELEHSRAELALASRIRDSADSLTAMFDELLDLSRLEGGTIEAHMADFPLGPLIDQPREHSQRDLPPRGHASPARAHARWPPDRIDEARPAGATARRTRLRATRGFRTGVERIPLVVWIEAEMAHCECGLGAIADVQNLEDGADVGLDGPQRDAEDLADLGVRQAARHEAKDFELLRREATDRVGTGPGSRRGERLRRFPGERVRGR